MTDRKPLPIKLPSWCLTACQVLEILRSDDDISVLAVRYGKSETTIRDVLHGKSFQHVHPEIPRRVKTGQRSCYDCQNWRGRCRMEFPDPLEEGPEFAVDCATFLPIDMSSTH